MKTITFKVYEYDELNDKAQQNVVERYRKDAVFKNENSSFTKSLKRSLDNKIIKDLDNILVFDVNRLKIKPVKDVKFSLFPDAFDNDDHFRSLYGDNDNKDDILNAEYTLNYDGKNKKKITVTSNIDLGFAYSVVYYLAGVITGTIEWIEGLVEGQMNTKSCWDIREYVSDMLFHVDGSDLTEGEKLVIEERKNIT
jgi:hypothetical protein